MKVEIRELEIELIPENEHDRDALVRLARHSSVLVTYGASTDPNWPPDPRKTNVKLVLPNLNKWGR